MVKTMEKPGPGIETDRVKLKKYASERLEIR